MSKARAAGGPEGVARPTLRAGAAAAWLVVTGVIAAVAAVAAEGRLGPRDPRATDPTSWWGILPPTPPSGTTRGTLAGLSAVAVVALCVCWVGLVRLAVTGRLRPRAAVAATVAWAAPFALGPPLFSRDAYAYAAQGELARRGLDPATHGVAALGGDPAGVAFTGAVDPRWRDTHTPYGGGAVAVERLAASVAHLLGAGPTAAIVTLRIVSLTGVALLVLCTARLADSGAGGVAVRNGATTVGGRPAVTVAIALVGANPVTIVHLVGGMHLDALVAAVLTAALLLDRRRPSRPPGAGGPTAWRGPVSLAGVGATALACFAGTVKATAFLGLLWLLVAHARAAKASGRTAVAVAVAVDLVVAAAVLALSMVASGFGPTWLHALATSGALTTGVAPASLLAALIAALARIGGAHLATGSGSPLLTAARDLTLGLAGLVCARLLWLAWRRPAGTGQDGSGRLDDGLVVLGIGGLAVALGSPVIYPWYLAPCLPMLGVLAAGWHVGHERWHVEQEKAGVAVARRRCRATVLTVVLASIWLCGATLSPLAQTWRLLAPNGPDGTFPLVVTALGAAVALTAATLAARAPGHAGNASRPPAAERFGR
jgi:hypothetical protein